MRKYQKRQRYIATFFLLIFFPTLVPTNLFASNNGPKAPEAASFEPVDATDMVNLATGDMSYVMPLLNVPSPEGGYPITLAYHGGIAYDMESSWVGLGWNLNPGAIERGINGSPDDWKEALIRSRNYYHYQSESLDIGVSAGLSETASIDVGVTYGWDSNGTKYGTINLGVGAKVGDGNQVGGGYSVGYSNRSGLLFNAYIGYQDKSGLGVGASAGTNGAGVGASYSLSMGKLGSGKDAATLKSTIGISLSTNGISGSYSMSAGSGDSGFSINSDGLGDITQENMSFAIPIFPAVWLKIGKRKIKYDKDLTQADFLTGPLYYNTFYSNSNNSPIGSTYSNSMGRESKRSYYMDVNEQRLPESEAEFVSYKDTYQKQKYDFTYPNYDNYIVNAQGLSGSMTPRLFESGILVGKPEYFEIEKSNPTFGGMTNSGVFVPPVPGLENPEDFINIGTPTPYKKYTLETYLKNWNYNINTKKFTKTFGSGGQNDTNKVNFYFENSFPSNLIITPSNILTSTGSDIINYIGNNNSYLNRQHNSNYVEVYTNSQIANGADILEAKNGENIYNRTAESGYSPDGIGAYKITTPDGKTYHYSMPVYQYEEVYRQLKNTPDGFNNNSLGNGGFFYENKFYHEQRKIQPYATHWVLTAVTGPDFYDVNQNHIADEGDYGYWTRLDYGKWTEGYTWRAPYEGFNDFNQYANYDNEENAREYAWGRKQLVYLNKVVTRTHTALFVKSLRKDSKSKSIGEGGYPSFEGDEGVYYPMQRSLKLDEIILVKNEFANAYSNTQVQSITENAGNLVTVNWNSPIVKNYKINNSLVNNKVQYRINQQSLVLDNGDLQKDLNGKYLIYQNAVKIIKLNQDYSLAKNSPHSDDLTKGRLTLNSVKVLGRDGLDYLPPTTFDYFNRDLAYANCFSSNCSAKNPWGYNSTIPQAWSMKSITTPTGAKIEFELEKDTYWTEAFSRRYWTEDLMFRGIKQGNDLIIEVENKTGITSGTGIYFTDYFMPNEKVFLDLCIWKRNRWRSGMFNQNNNDESWRLDLNSDQYCEVINVTPTRLTIKSPSNANKIWGNVGCADSGNDCWFARQDNPIIGSHVYEDVPRNTEPPCPSPGVGSAQPKHHAIYYNLLANKVPGEGTGGGLRVKAISAIDESGNRFTTEYNYNHPTKGRTTGITSFAPVRGLKYIPYQSELPAPRVMYEYVTVSEKQSNGGSTKYNGKTVYQFNVLENADNIFNPNMRVGEVFRSTVTTNDNLNPSKKLKSANIKLEDNTSILGSVVAVTRYNNANQIISKKTTKYKTLNELRDGVANNNIKGAVQESFQSMKSIHKHTSNYITAQVGLQAIFANYTSTQKGIYGASIEQYNRFLSVSSKITYPSSVSYTEELDPIGIMKKTWQEDRDPINGLFNSTITKKSDGTLIKKEIVPAYTKYPAMGSKVDNINNKNMLTQEAMSISSVKIGNTWKTTGASITTWNDTWKYRNEISGTDVIENSNRVWRKHKTFAWKENLDTNGAYSTNISSNNTQFNWGLGTPVSDKWQKLSEITRYTRWSMPIETKDINGNLASTKMGDNDTKVLVSGNARYSEIYYSGAENVKSGNLFDGEVKGANFRTSDAAHTGKYAVKALNINDKVFEVTGTSGADNYYSNTDNYSATFRPGKYKVSFWAYKSSSTNLPRMASNYSAYASLKVNGEHVPYESVENAGCWQLQNYVIDILPNTNYTIAVNAPYIFGDNYFDDFRMCPIASDINSYVYDSKTDELLCVLNANNLGSAFKYDNAGRLIANYIEIIDTPTQTGGFKITSQFKQKYKGSTGIQSNVSGTIDNCLNNVVISPMTANISTECWASFENKYKTNVTGGSGNFSYEYKWVIDYNNNIYSNYVVGSNIIYIPYVPMFCSSNTYNRAWKFKVKITDNVTGQTLEIPYQFNSNSCNNTYNYPNDFAFLQVSRCFDFCGNNDYTFKVHLKNIGLNGNFKYEYANYQPYNPALNNTFESQTLQWIDISSTQGKFCPPYSLISSSNCAPGEYRKIYYIAFRIKNINTGEVSIHYPYNIVGDCINGSSLRESIIENVHEVKILEKYLEEGNVIKRDNKGINVKEVESINDKVK